MEQILRKIVEKLVLMCAYIPLGIASIAFIASLIITVQQGIQWVNTGEWNTPKLFETVNMDFLSLLMDERVSGFRITLIKVAAKVASLPVPLFCLITGSICLCIGLVLLSFSKAIKQAGER